MKIVLFCLFCFFYAVPTLSHATVPNPYSTDVTATHKSERSDQEVVDSLLQHARILLYTAINYEPTLVSDTYLQRWLKLVDHAQLVTIESPGIADGFVESPTLVRIPLAIDQVKFGPYQATFVVGHISLNPLEPGKATCTPRFDVYLKLPPDGSNPGTTIHVDLLYDKRTVESWHEVTWHAVSQKERDTYLGILKNLSFSNN